MDRIFCHHVRPLIPSDEICFLGKPCASKTETSMGFPVPIKSTWASGSRLINSWAMAIPGETYVVYARGLSAELELQLDSRPSDFQVRRFNPRTGEFTDLGKTAISQTYSFQPPDTGDWVVLLERE